MQPLSNPFIRKGLLLLSAPRVLPQGISKSFTVINNIHWLWRLCSVGHRVRENSVSTLLTKKIFSFWVGDNRCIQVAAQFALGAKRLLDCADGCTDLYYSYLKLDEVVRGYYPINEIEIEPLEISIEWIALTGLQTYKASLEKTVQYVIEVTRCLFQVMRRLFTLSMLTLDTIDAFYLSPSSREESIEEFGGNLKEVISRFTEDSAFLLEKLKTNRQFMQWIFIEGRAGFTIDQVINVVEVFVKGSESLKDVVDSVNPSNLSEASAGFENSIEKLGQWCYSRLVTWVKSSSSLLSPSLPLKAKDERFLTENKAMKLDKQKAEVLNKPKIEERAFVAFSEREIIKLKAALYPEG